MAETDNPIGGDALTYGELAAELGALADERALLKKRIAKLEAKNERLRESLRWRSVLPGNVDECMEIAVPLRGGWYRCIGYVLDDHTITDFDGEYVGYDWEHGSMWRPLTDLDNGLALQEADDE